MSNTNALSQGRALIDEARQSGSASLNEAAGKALLSAYGIRTPKSVVAADAADGQRLAADLTGPFVVKVMSGDILHKSDAGGVALHLADAAAIAAAITQMSAKPVISAASVDGWLLEEMAPAGCEIVVGGVIDPQFGPMVMVGLGGIFVEILQDVAFRLCPVQADDVLDMVEELQGKALLHGARGQEGVSLDALVDVVLRIGGAGGVLTTLQDDIAEIDLNPVIVTGQGAVAVDARVVISEARKVDPISKTPVPRADLPVLELFRPLFEPKAVAVLGASTKSVTLANTFIRRMRDFNYGGKLFAIHPSAKEIEGVPAYPSLAETPEPIDYAYVAIGSERIPDTLKDAAGNVAMTQVISSGFSEVSGGNDLERDLVEKAHRGGSRVLGPNSLGTYSPRGGLTFPVDAPREVGTIGIISQSGGLTTDIIKRGQVRGLRYSGAVTIGNSCDITPTDLVAFYQADPQTKAIGIYLEDIKDGRAFFELLRGIAEPKPIVILRGGQSSQGRSAAVSHTGALAGDSRALGALTRQCVVAMVATVDEFIDALLALQHLTLRPDRTTKSVTLFGNGGGSSVLGADAFARYGLDVLPYPAAAVERLEALALPPGTSVVNPVDTPVGTLQVEDGWVAGKILDIIYEYAQPDAIAMHLNLAAFVGRGSVDPVDNLFKVIEATQAKWPGHAHFALALRTDGSANLDEKRRTYRERARAVGVPVYDEIAPMARALATVSLLERATARCGG